MKHNIKYVPPGTISTYSNINTDNDKSNGNGEDCPQSSLLPMSEIYADPELNCRGEIIPHHVSDLANSIKDVGLQQPIVVQPFNSIPGYKYRIIVGHRRHKAYQVLRRDKIPAIIRSNLNEVQTRVLNLKENLDRKDLNIMQEALAIKKFKDAGYTMKEVAEMLGLSTGWVQCRYNLLAMEPEIQNAAIAGFLTQEQIKGLYSLPTKEKRFEAVRIIKETKQRGERKAVKIKELEDNKNPLLKKHRKRNEIFDMQELIINSIGASFGTRCLAWAAGEISDLDLYRDIKEIADEQGVMFLIPINNPGSELHPLERPKKEEELINIL